MKNCLNSILLSMLLSIFSIGLFADPLPAPMFDSIGEGGFKADTQNTIAQKYFNQGMVFFYGFDYLEAIRSFEAAATLDKQCSRCQFALALSLGSISNAFIKGDELERANEILEQTHSNDPLTQGLLDALVLRYQNIPQKSLKNPSNHHCAEGEINLPAKNKVAFSNALFALALKYPDDLTTKALFAFSVLGTDNWDLYNKLVDIKPYANMMVNACENILKVNPNHIGAIHYYIHGTEWSNNPAQSLKYANNLSILAPLAEHLVHMPSHIYLRLGDYNKAVSQNEKALKSYAEYEAICKKQGFKPVVNFLNQHNYDFLFASAALAGRADVAYNTANKVRKITPIAWLHQSNMMQRFYALQLFAIAHFGQWDLIKPLGEEEQQFPYLKAIWAYTKALESLNLHHQQDFDTYFQMFIKASIENNAYDPAKNNFANNLKIAKQVLLANKEREAGHWEQAIFHWHKASNMQDAGGDPPSWYFPTILGLGYTLLDAGKPEQAVLTFEAALDSNPENGWALYGLAKAYETLGQTEKTHEFEQRFKKTWHSNAIPLPIKQGSDLFISSLN